MRLTILGGGGFRVPLVHGALLRDAASRRVTEVVLHDTDPARLDVVRQVLADQAERHTVSGGELAPPVVTATTRLDEALEGADFVFSAIRVGGLEGRVADERVALDLGVLGQETTGAGGVAYGLRTVPVAVDVAERVRRTAPEAWVINFTNPAGLVTQAMQGVLGDRVVGICDSPLGLAKRAAGALGLRLDDVAIDYAGLNHLGWLQGLRVGGRDVLPELLGDAERLGTTEEGRLFGADWIATIGLVPNEYLYYYDFTRDAVAGIWASPQTRGEYLLESQTSFYTRLGSSPAAQGRSRSALETWERVRHERDETYMQEERHDGEQRAASDVEGGGYEGVALALMHAIAQDDPATLILNVRNGIGASPAIPGLPADAIVEVPCAVDARGPRPLPVSPLRGRPLGLVQQVKAVDELVVRAALERSEPLAVQAFASHPLVDSVTVARQLLTGYRARIPALDAVFGAPGAGGQGVAGVLIR